MRSEEGSCGFAGGVPIGLRGWEPLLEAWIWLFLWSYCRSQQAPGMHKSSKWPQGPHMAFPKSILRLKLPTQT